MKKVTFTMFISFIVNTILSTAKIFLGLFLNSISVLIDGIQTFSDMSTDMITISNENLKEERDLKLRRCINFLTGFIILALGLVSVYLATCKSIKNPDIALLLIVPVTIVIKYILSTYVLSKGILYNNNILINNSHENDLDVISSIVVLLSLIVTQLKDYLPFFKYADMVAGVIVACFIIKIGFDVLSREINDIMAKPYNNEELKTKINNTIRSNENVLDIISMELLKYGPYYELNVSITLNDNISIKKANAIAHAIERKLKVYYPELDYITIKINNESK